MYLQCKGKLQNPGQVTWKRPPPHKRARYTPYLLPAAISVASENYVSTLATPSDSPDILPTDDPNILHVMKNMILTVAG